MPPPQQKQKLWTHDRNDDKNIARDDVLVPLLASRSCHLPGNTTWMEDWWMWMSNNHIVLGICFHHPLHPVESWERCLLLTASISFGLIVTNLLVVYNDIIINHFLFIFNTDGEGEAGGEGEGAGDVDDYYDDQLTAAAADDDTTTTTISTITMIILWTLGGLCHSIFDVTVWHIMACSCCHPGGKWGHTKHAKKYRDCGSYALIPIIICLLGCAILVVLLRASSSSSSEAAAIMTTEDENYEEEEQAAEEFEDNSNNDDDETTTTSSDIMIHHHSHTTINIEDWKSFTFLYRYGIELVMAWFVYFPIVGTIVFSGVLGCNGKIPVLGGRPRDLKQVEEPMINFLFQYQRK